MKRILTLIITCTLLAGCAVNVGEYNPPLDTDLVTPETAIHLEHCQKLVQAQAPGKFSKPDIENTVKQTATQSFASWVSAAELWTATAAEAATGFTIFGMVIGIHSNNTSDQSQAESNVRQCMANYHEPITEKP